MYETAFSAFATFFATVGPIEAAVLFAAISPRFTRRERVLISVKACVIATAILLFFALLGTEILAWLGVTFAALQAAGGIILFIIAIDMIFETKIAGSTMSVSESAEATSKDEIAVFPLATPIIAGPGAMSAAMLLMAGSSGDLGRQSAVIGALLLVMLLQLALLLLAQELRGWIGVTAQSVIMRVAGVLLAAIAMQSLFNGIATSAIFAKT